MPLDAKPGDAILIGMLRQQAMAEMNVARTARIWNDVEGQVAQLTRSDVTQARRARQRLLDEAMNRKLVNATANYDDLLRAVEDGGELQQLIEIHKGRAENRWRDLVEAPGVELELQEQIADAFEESVQATSELALLRGESLHSLMSSKDRMLTQVAQSVWGIDDPNVAAHAFAPIENMMRHLGDDGANRVAAAGGFVGKHFRLAKGNNARHVATIRRSARSQVETDQLLARMTNATEEVDGFSGYTQIIDKHGVKIAFRSVMTEMVQLAMEHKRVVDSGRKIVMFRNNLPDSRIKRFAAALTDRVSSIATST
jgi:hypothetical protein